MTPISNQAPVAPSGVPASFATRHKSDRPISPCIDDTNDNGSINLSAAPSELSAPKETQISIEEVQSPDPSQISNADFVAALFRDVPESASALICSKSSDPTLGGWYPSPANSVVGGLQYGKNNYINGSAFYKDIDGLFKVRKEQFAACHFVMLDDLGTKGPIEQLGGFKLSWLLETSPGNYQGGIIFSKPITDGPVAEQLLNGLIAAELCDKGATGPLTRWARLPGGINGKPKYFDEKGKPFRCRLVLWNPDARYTPDEVSTSLHLILDPLPTHKTVDDSSNLNTTSKINAESTISHRATPSSKNQKIIKLLLDYINADIEHTDWLHVLMATHFEFGGSEAGLNLANAWSSKGDKYKGLAEIKHKWSYFKLDKEKSFNIGTIINMVKANGFDWQAICAAADEPFKKLETLVVPCVRKSLQLSPAASVSKVDVVTTVPIVEKSVMVGSGKLDDAVNPLDKFSLRGMSGEIEKNAVDAVPVLGQLALQGQATVFYAAPNTGKTLITLSLLVDAIQHSLVNPSLVYYLNMDDTSSGVVDKLRIAEEHGFHVLAEGHRDFSANQFLGHISEMVEKDQAHGVVIILDTLKKFVNLMDKGKSSSFTKVVRQFVMKGGTLVALAHTNKNPGQDGKPVYGGTSDIMDDFDCAYTLAPITQKAGSSEKVVEFENKKRRGNVVPNAAYSYNIQFGTPYTDILLSVQPVDETQLEPMKQAEQLASDAEVINTVIASIGEGINTKMKLADAVAKRAGVSKRNALQIIDKYTGGDPAKDMWTYSVHARGAKVYALLDRTPPNQGPDTSDT